MKKVLIFGGVIVVLFAALYFVNDASQSKSVEGNPFGKDKLDRATIAQLDDPNYQNQILPDELSEALANEEDLFVYFYSPTCEYCKQASPILVPTAEDVGVDLKLLNLLEFQEAWRKFGVDQTPTVIRYENGEEVFRVVGLQSEDIYRQFLEQGNVQ